MINIGFSSLFNKIINRRETGVKSCIARQSEISRQNSPAFLIIGAQKSGTTALYEYLSKHPCLKPSSIKEIDFFSCNEIYNKGYDYYHSHFVQDVDENKLFFEASPSYLNNEDAPERIYKYNPMIKLVAVLRNPVDRAFSAWNMYVNNYRSNPDWFYNWMVRSDSGYADRKVLRRNANSMMNFLVYVNEEMDAYKSGVFIESPVLSHGLYSKQLNNYLRFFERNQIFLVENTALKNDTMVILRSIESFIGIDHIKWDDYDLGAVFKGDYNSPLCEEAVRVLEKYYEQANKDLFHEFGIDFKPLVDCK